MKQRKSFISAASGCLMVAGLAFSSAPTLAAAKITVDDDTWVSVGAGLRAGLTIQEDGSPNGESASKNFDVQSMRLYINGQVNKVVGLTFNTEEIFGDGPVDVLDAFARFEFHPAFNVWAGRLLTPADRIEMNGPYYGLTWNQYTQPLFASDQGGAAGTYGRDDGLVFWGKVNKFSYAIGAFDGVNGSDTVANPNQSDNLLYAARFAFNFLNVEQNPAYYTSSTYYGGLGNILTLGLSAQAQKSGVGDETDSGDFSGYAVDLLSENVLGDAGVLTIEAEYKKFESDYSPADLPVQTGTDKPCFCLFDGESTFVSVAYLLPGEVGPGKLQPYVRAVQNDPADEGAESTELTELGLNYILSGHNARLNLNFASGDANISGYKNGDKKDSISLGLQVQL